jgi:hypothetical protein
MLPLFTVDLEDHRKLAAGPFGDLGDRRIPGRAIDERSVLLGERSTGAVPAVSRLFLNWKPDRYMTSLATYAPGRAV